MRLDTPQQVKSKQYNKSEGKAGMDSAREGIRGSSSKL